MLGRKATKTASVMPSEMKQRRTVFPCAAANEEKSVSIWAVIYEKVFSLYLVGVLALIILIMLWVTSSLLTQRILEEYNKPFLMTFLNCTIFHAYFIFLCVRDPMTIIVEKKKKETEAAAAAANSNAHQQHLQEKDHSSLTHSAISIKSNSGGHGSEKIPQSTVTCPSNGNHNHVPSTESLLSGAAEDEVLAPLTTKETAKLGLYFFAIYFAANYFTNASFNLTSVGSAAILASTCGFFTLIIGRIFKVETFTVLKCLAVLISFVGVVLLSIAEFSGAATNRVRGNIYALIGAIFYGCYSVVLKRTAKDESRVNMPLLFAFVGLYTALFTWPVFYILDYTGEEVFHLPTSRLPYVYLMINMVMGSLIPNYLWNVAFVLTSPLVVAIGISFNIPITLVADWLVKGTPIEMYKIWSSVFVILGFSLVSYTTLYPRFDNWCNAKIQRMWHRVYNKP